MELRFWIETESGLPHMYDHGVTEEEVQQVMRGRGEEFPGSDDSRIRLGQTEAGRYLQVVYVPDADGESAFVVTAYDTVTGAVIGDRQITCVPIADPDAPAVPTAPTLPEPPTIGEIWNATNIPTPSLSTSPITDGVTGLETWLWATGPDTITVTTAPLNGYTVTGTATRTGYTFDFDDGPIPVSYTHLTLPTNREV